MVKHPGRDGTPHSACLCRVFRVSGPHGEPERRCARRKLRPGLFAGVLRQAERVFEPPLRRLDR